MGKRRQTNVLKHSHCTSMVICSLKSLGNPIQLMFCRNEAVCVDPCAATRINLRALLELLSSCWQRLGQWVSCSMPSYKRGCVGEKTVLPALPLIGRLLPCHNTFQFRHPQEKHGRGFYDYIIAALWTVVYQWLCFLQVCYVQEHGLINLSSVAR